MYFVADKSNHAKKECGLNLYFCILFYCSKNVYGQTYFEFGTYLHSSYCIGTAITLIP